VNPRIIPVIHYADDEQAMRNAGRVFDAGCDGVLLIEMQGRSAPLPAIAGAIKDRWPERLVGINFLGVDPAQALLWNVDGGLDMTWTDEQLTHSSGDQDGEAEEVREVLAAAPGHLLFAGVAFKHQREEHDPVEAALKAVRLGFVPTTSGPATGVAAEAGKIARLRIGIGPEAPLAIASGIDPANASQFSPYLSHVLVATGVSTSFHEFDPAKLRDLCAACGRL
jgi:predicted TIM-barrel enzyme